MSVDFEESEPSLDTDVLCHAVEFVELVVAVDDSTRDLVAIVAILCAVIGCHVCDCDLVSAASASDRIRRVMDNSASKVVINGGPL